MVRPGYRLEIIYRHLPWLDLEELREKMGKLAADLTRPSNSAQERIGRFVSGESHILPTLSALTRGLWEILQAISPLEERGATPLERGYYELERYFFWSDRDLKSSGRME